ncbi:MULTISPECIES: McrC family protein [unclassified Nocardioides]|uniref:McrC family protein n=1 Tax=unclassified Nocardioides TaxID=2615069 RepID=UPI00005712AA|nr:MULTISPECIES: McrC family protein [unclassified Nocardioides]ABL79354.1 McrBC 5-methylcytosine restriction system component-like protein [Nocardioides sp. JS614]
MTRADLEHLTEGQRLYPVDLTRAEAAALNRSGLVTAQPDVDGWRVTAEHAVGAVRRGDLVVRVTPKVGAAKVLTLLARAQGVRGLKVDPELVGVAPHADISAVLAVLFAQEAATAMAAGPLRGYRSEDQTLPVLRGRVRLREQHLRRFGLPVPLEVTVDEWTLDTDDNRRTRAAATALLALPGVPEHSTQALRRLDRLLGEAKLLAPGAPLEPWTPTRLNVKMHRLLHLADVVLAHTSVEHEAGATQTHGFVVNMAWLFETLIARLLEEQTLGLVPQQTMPLDTLGRLSIKPDLLFDGPGGVVAVADTKYKLLDDNGKVPNADVYQLVTYCARLGLSTGHLIYSSDEPGPDPFGIVGTNVLLVVHAVDVSRPVDVIEQQVREIGLRLLATGIRESGSTEARPLTPAG